MDGPFISALLKFGSASSGDVGSMLIAAALIYLALEVRNLRKVVDGVRETIGKEVFPRLNELRADVSKLQGQIQG